MTTRKTRKFASLLTSVSIATLFLFAASCSGNGKKDKEAEHKPDSLVIRQVMDTAYTPLDPKDSASPLIPKLIPRQDTLRIKR
jgi:hypothetical protein